MESCPAESDTIDERLAERLKSLRAERGWSLDDLAARSKVSRATLSRLENAEVSPTTSVLGRLCAAYGLAMSRLMLMVEDQYAPLIRQDDQQVWVDAETGFRRRAISPPAQSLSGEAIRGDLRPGTQIVYEDPPRPGLEHHLLLVEGRLSVTVDGTTHDLLPGDCLRYRLFGPSAFATPANSPARYILFMV